MDNFLDKDTSLYIDSYREIKNLLEKKIDLSKLPVIGESKIVKYSADRYGHIILKLDLEKDGDLIKRMHNNFYSYSWEVNEAEIPKEYQELIVKELIEFSKLFRFLNSNDVRLRFSIIGGGYKDTERPFHSMCTVEAIKEIFKKLNN